MQLIRRSHSPFFVTNLNSPKLRISLCVLGLSLAVAGAGCDKLGLGNEKTPTSPTGPPAAGSVVRYTAVGASDVTGYGSSVPCLLLDCANGMGYVAQATRQLRASGFSVTLSNLGLPTAVLSRRIQTLGQQNGHLIAGNFLDNELPFITADATIVSIFAGANDVNVITSALGGGAGASNPAAYVDDQVRAFGDDYGTLISGIRNTAKSARIIVLNLPNMAGLPFLSGAPLGQRQAAQRAAVGMTTTVINRLRDQGAVVIDLMCDARYYQPSFFSSDGFHPNDSGYTYLAGELVRAITLASYPAPSASCPQMSLVQ
jgi:lysophospholipase L1-like esterase